MKALFLSTLSRAINHYLLLDPDSEQRLMRLRGKAVTVELMPFKLSFQCLFSQSGVNIHPEILVQSDTVIRGTPLQLFGMMMTEDKRHAFFANDLTIEGSAELGQQVADLFDQIDIDWEEQFSRLVGDVPAYHSHRLLKKVGGWLKQAGRSLSDDINEYLHEEAAWFPTDEALKDFYQAVDTYGLDVERLHAKVQQLRNAIMDSEAAS